MMAPEQFEAEKNYLAAREIAEEIAAKVNAQVVQVVGRTFVLFRQKEKDSQIKLPRA